MKKVIILTGLCLMGQTSNVLAGPVQIRDFQTTRLNSTAGAGVASVLSTEAGLLNPAAAAFFEGSSFSYQSYSTNLRDENSQRALTGEDFPNRNQSTGYFIADHSGPVKGGLSYLQQNENHFDREQLILHASSPMGPRSSMGISYRYVQDQRPESFTDRRKYFHQVSIGTTHILDQDTIIGLVIVDPTRSNAGDERLLGGFQYSLADRFILIGDAGYQFSGSIAKDYLWRGAVQLNIFSDFFFRVGRFYDNITGFKGMGWGVGWIGPKLGVEFAQKYSEQFTKEGYLHEGETLVDTSLSAILKF
jgi:hypothetical protein